MFKVMKWMYIDPCTDCEQLEEWGWCPDCPEFLARQEAKKARPSPYHEGRLIIASGEDAHAFV